MGWSVVSVLFLWLWMPQVTSQSLQTYLGTKTLPSPHGRFVHFTDIHVDRYYKAGATIASSCHQRPKKHMKKKQGNETLAGVWGAPATECDAPEALAYRSLEWIGNEWRDAIDFVLWTGDNARHDIDTSLPREEKEIIGYNKHLITAVKKAFRLKNNATVPIVPCIGNNDIHPHNQLAGGTLEKKNPILETYSVLWKDFIPEDQQTTFRLGGYFSVDVVPGIRVLALNTLYFFSSNKRVQGCRVHEDPGQIHMAWIETQLSKARREQYKVYMVGHVGPSPKTFRPECLEDYVQLSLAYEDVLQGHMYGHANYDHFQLLTPADSTISTASKDVDGFVGKLRAQYDSVLLSDPSAVVAVHVAPPILPIFYPTFRVNTFEKNANSPYYGTWQQYTQWYSNLTYWNNQASLFSSPPPRYEIEYSTEKAYGMSNLTTTSWLEFAARMRDPSPKGKALWKMYLDNMFVQTANDRN
ncbi:Metallo-dependent phosphatase-like protein [Spinellus fusiger]|nr:Metallo-dependent phosphatase-like protein [Spinellus fusiger]